MKTTTEVNGLKWRIKVTCDKLLMGKIVDIATEADTSEGKGVREWEWVESGIGSEFGSGDGVNEKRENMRPRATAGKNEIGKGNEV